MTAEVIHKSQSKSRLISTDDDARSATFLLTNGTVDRDGETVNPLGADLADYAKNSVVLFNHASDSFPIGMMHRLDPDYDGPPEIWNEEVDGKPALLGRVYFSKENPQGDLAYRMVKEGTLKGGSISFLPVGQAMKGQGGGAHYDQWRLLEFSVCPIPSNSEALRLGKQLKALDKGTLEHIGNEAATWLNTLAKILTWPLQRLIFGAGPDAPPTAWENALDQMWRQHLSPQAAASKIEQEAKKAVQSLPCRKGVVEKDWKDWLAATAGAVLSLGGAPLIGVPLSIASLGAVLYDLERTETLYREGVPPEQAAQQLKPLLGKAKAVNKGESDWVSDVLGSVFSGFSGYLQYSENGRKLLRQIGSGVYSLGSLAASGLGWLGDKLVGLFHEGKSPQEAASEVGSDARLHKAMKSLVVSKSPIDKASEWYHGYVVLSFRLNGGYRWEVYGDDGKKLLASGDDASESGALAAAKAWCDANPQVIKAMGEPEHKGVMDWATWAGKVLATAGITVGAVGGAIAMPWLGAQIGEGAAGMMHNLWKEGESPEQAAREVKPFVKSKRATSMKRKVYFRGNKALVLKSGRAVTYALAKSIMAKGVEEIEEVEEAPAPLAVDMAAPGTEEWVEEEMEEPEHKGGDPDANPPEPTESDMNTDENGVPIKSKANQLGGFTVGDQVNFQGQPAKIIGLHVSNVGADADGKERATIRTASGDQAVELTQLSKSVRRKSADGPAGDRALRSWMKAIEDGMRDIEKPEVISAGNEALKAMQRACKRAYKDLDAGQDMPPDDAEIQMAMEDEEVPEQQMPEVKTAVKSKSAPPEKIKALVAKVLANLKAMDEPLLPAEEQAKDAISDCVKGKAAEGMSEEDAFKACGEHAKALGTSARLLKKLKRHVLKRVRRKAIGTGSVVGTPDGKDGKVMFLNGDEATVALRAPNGGFTAGTAKFPVAQLTDQMMKDADPAEMVEDAQADVDAGMPEDQVAMALGKALLKGVRKAFNVGDAVHVADATGSGRPGDGKVVMIEDGNRSREHPGTTMYRVTLDGGQQGLYSENELTRKSLRKRLSKADRDDLTAMADYLDDAAGASDTPKRLSAGMQYHSAKVRSKLVDPAPEADPMDAEMEVTPEMEMAVKSLAESVDGMSTKLYRASGRRF